MNVAAIIVAAGDGRRMGGETPKPYVPLCGRPMVLRTLEPFFSSRTIGNVVLVVAANELSRCEALLRADIDLARRSWVLQVGGMTRQQSVQKGLEKIADDVDIVVVHDGDRPLVSRRLIDRCVKAAGEKGAVVAGMPVTETIKVVSQNRWVQSTPVRSTLWTIQTPQAFRKGLIVKAHERAARQGTEASDDAMLVEAMGEPVYVLEGEETNFKITVPQDMWLAETLIREKRNP